VFPVRAPTPLEAGRGPRPCARAAMHPTATVSHRWTLTGGPTPRLRAASAGGRNVTRRIPVFQPAAPLRMGFIAHFGNPPPACASLVRACQRQRPVHHSPPSPCASRLAVVAEFARDPLVIPLQRSQAARQDASSALQSLPQNCETMWSRSGIAPAGKPLILRSCSRRHVVRTTPRARLAPQRTTLRGRAGVVG
jgi:hypothetical protein